MRPVLGPAYEVDTDPNYSERPIGTEPSVRLAGFSAVSARLRWQGGAWVHVAGPPPNPRVLAAMQRFRPTGDWSSTPTLVDRKTRYVYYWLSGRWAAAGGGGSRGSGPIPNDPDYKALDVSKSDKALGNRSKPAPPQPTPRGPTPKPPPKKATPDPRKEGTKKPAPVKPHDDVP